MQQQSKYIRHENCPKCGSSDANAVFDDGHSWCFKCSTYTSGADGEANTVEQVEQSTNDLLGLVIPSGAVVALPDRKITKASCAHYGVTVAGDRHYYPYTDAKGNTVAAKIRSVKDKKFSIAGSVADAVLFGQSTFTKGGKYCTLVEGELDALAAFQMTGSQWPVVSIPSGAQSALKAVKANFEWLDSFDSVVLCFDGDAPGIKATEEVAEFFGGKAKIMKHCSGYKDACDYLKAGKDKLFVDTWWKAEAYKPEGVVTVSDIKERMLAPPVAGIPWCFPTLSGLTYGRRAGELYGFGAGVGVGKTDVFTQQIAYDIQELNKKVGVIYLEQNVVETAQRVIGKMDKKLYHIPDGSFTRGEYLDAVDRLEETGQLFMMEHFGSMSWAAVKGTIKYFAKSLDIKMIYLDHLTALSAQEVDERRALDAIMADMASLAQENGLIIHFVSHLTTPEGKAHEEGGRVLEKHFTGSRAIARWSHYMFGLERDKQHADAVQRQTTTVRVLKDRFTGSATGERFGIRYDRETGYLNEVLLQEQEAL